MYATKVENLGTCESCGHHVLLLDKGEVSPFPLCACKKGMKTIARYLKQQKRAAWWDGIRQGIQEAGVYLDTHFPRLQGRPQRVSERAVYVLNHLEHTAKRIERRNHPSRWDYLMRD